MLIKDKGGGNLFLSSELRSVSICASPHANSLTRKNISFT